MPFAIPAAIGAGASIFGSLLGKKASNQQAQQQAQMQAMLQPLVNDERTRKTTLFNSGQTDLATARSTLADPMSFFSKILNASTGNQQSMMDALGPEYDQIDKQESGALQASQYGPRSGFAAALTRIHDEASGNKNRLLLQLRPQAANALSQIASIFASLGGSETGQSDLGGLINSLIGQSESAANRASENSRAMGQGVGSILATLLGPGGILNRGGGSRSSGGGSWGTFNPGFPSTGGGG